MKIINKFSEVGFFSMLKCIASRLYLHALRIFFKFDIWHASAPLSCRPYKKIVANEVLSHGVTSLVEVGCGLGDIGRLLKNNLIYGGIDLDKEAIRAAKFIDKRLNVIVGTFQQLQCFKYPFQAVLLLNWPHGIPFATLAEQFNSFPLSVKYIFIDGIRKDAPDLGFSYRHSIADFDSLSPNWKVFRQIESIDAVRDLFVLQRGSSLDAGVSV